MRKTYALIAYTVLALAFTWPLLPHITTHVIGPRGDNLEYVWKMWWVPDALRRGESPFFAPHIAYPEGYALAYGEITPAHTFYMAPLTATLGATVAYNLAVLLSLILGGWLVYLLCGRWLPDAGPGVWFLAGAAFTFSSYHAARISGHLPLIDVHWLALALYGLERWLEGRRARNAVVVGAGVGLAALSSWYYGLICALLLPVYALAYGGRALLADRRAWAAGALAVIVFAVLAGPFLLPYVPVFRAGQGEVTLEEAVFWSGSLLDYVVPNPRHPIWGDAVQSLIWPLPGDVPYEFFLAFGWPVLALAPLGWRHTRGSRRWSALKWVTIAALILSLGPELKLGRLPLGVPLPARLVWEFVPGAGGMRSWGRFSVYGVLGAALLAAAGLHAAIRSYSGRARRILALAAVGAVMFAAWIGPAELTEVAPRPVDEWLAAQPGGGALMQYPVEVALSGPSTFYTRYHGKPVVFGYGTYYPFRFREEYPEVLAFPDDAALDRLAAWGVRWVLVALDAETDAYTLAEIDAQPRLRHAITLGDQAVYELVE